MAKQIERNRKKAFAIILVMLIIITLAAVCVAVWALWFKDDEMIAPDRAPQIEENAEDILGDAAEDKMQQPENGGAVSIVWSDVVNVNISANKLTLLFGNPHKSNQDMVLQVVVQDEIIATSGKLVAGKQITELELAKGVVNRLSEGEYNGKFVVSYYDSNSGEKAILNSEIPVNIKVK